VDLAAGGAGNDADGLAADVETDVVAAVRHGDDPACETASSSP
jgi:hypothetical protein